MNNNHDPFDEFGAPHYDTPPERRYIQFKVHINHSQRSGKALRCIRESLGLSARDFSLFSNSSHRTVQRWEQAKVLPNKANSALVKLIEITDLWEAELAEASQVAIYRSGYREVDGFILPESWWRTLVGHVLLDNPLIPVELA